MKIIVDTNIVFSAILKTENKIGQLLTNSSNYFRFYSIDYSRYELEKHKNKILNLTHYSEIEYKRITELITHKITYIDECVIPIKTIEAATELVKDIDIDDAYFVALNIFLKAKLWTGDKVLISKLSGKGFKNLITTDELYLKYLLKERIKKRY